MSKTSSAPAQGDPLPGLKKISVQNWQMPDIPGSSNLSGEQWVQRVLEPQLNPNVPEEISRLFEIARGSMVYGWYFHPLITLACEQLYRVCELAVIKRCQKAGIPLAKKIARVKKPRERKFADLIKDLIKARIITAEDQKRWDATRQIRNLTSHSTSGTINTPGIIVTNLRLASDRINTLFA